MPARGRRVIRGKDSDMRKTWAAGQTKAAHAAVGLVLGAAVAAPALAVNRCTLEDGRVVYQDAACPAAASASRVRLYAPPPDPVGKQRATADVAAAAEMAKAREPVLAPAVAAGPAPQQPKSPIAALADACLNFYRPRLRDPAGAYWSEASRDALDVLWMTLHATNGYGGYVAKTVGCEVRNGRLDLDRTRQNSNRLGM